MSKSIFSHLVPIIALFSLLCQVHALIVTVGPRSDECFSEMVEKNNKLHGSFEVLLGGDHDINCKVLGPNNEVHYSVQRKKSGSFSVMAPVAGEYRMCLSNRMSTVTGKTVAFSLHKGDELFQDVARQEHISPLEAEITELSDAVTKVEDENQYMQAREATSRQTNVSTNKKVLWFSIMETGVLIGLGVWQVWTLRNFFESKRSY